VGRCLTGASHRRNGRQAAIPIGLGRPVSAAAAYPQCRHEMIFEKLVATVSNVEVDGNGSIADSL
jgi:hypothetical protein